MRRRNRSGGRIMLRGKPGLIVLVVLLLVGTLVAYYTWAGSSSSSATKTRYNKYGHKSKYPPQRNLNLGLRYGGQVPKGPQMQNPPNVGNKLLRGPVKPLQPPRNFDIQDGPKPDMDEDYKFNPEDDDEDIKEREDSKAKEESRENKFKQFDEKRPSAGILYPQLYVNPDPKMVESFRKMEHIVHMDLKGAPPKIDYLIKLIPIMKKLGATGLLLEYEDMFPYNNDLEMLASRDAYKTSDIVRLLNAAKVEGLKIIPLIQTFGHMEFVLKYPKYQDLREMPDTPQVITPTSLKSYELIQKMIDQVMTIHNDAPFLHIGCDEVYGLGKGKVEDMMKTSNLTSGQVFLKHVKTVASYVKNKYTKTKVIMWDDELRTKVSTADIEKSGLGSLVELMVWCYIPHPKERLPESIWIKYGKYFNGLWAASSFKGATGSAQVFTNVSYHLENHINWIQIIKDIKDIVPPEKFRGFALTGWQRYDHFAALCELLPSSIPSLAVNLQVVQNGGFNPEIHKTVSRVLNCSKLVELDYPKKELMKEPLPKKGENAPKKVEMDYIISHDCRFPGSDFYYAVQMYWATMDKFYSDEGLQSRIEGWLTDYHIKTHFSSPGHMKALQKKLIKILDKLKSMVEPIRTQLKGIYDVNTVEEWIMVHLTQKIDELRVKLNMANMLLQSKTWGKRPVPPTASNLPVQGTFNQNFNQPNYNQQQQQQQQFQQQQQQFPQQQQFQQQQQRFARPVSGNFNPGNKFIQSNNQVPQNTFGQPRNQQSSQTNQNQVLNQKWQGGQNNLLQRQAFGNQQSKFGMLNQQNFIGQQGGIGQKAAGSLNSRMQTGSAGQTQNTFNQNVAPSNQLLPSDRQQKPFDGLVSRLNKVMNPADKNNPSMPEDRRIGVQATGFGTGNEKNSVGKNMNSNKFLEKPKLEGSLTERSKDFPDRQKLKGGFSQGVLKPESKDTGLNGKENKMESESGKLENKFEIPRRGLRKGDFRDVDQMKKELQGKKIEYDEAEDKDGKN